VGALVSENYRPLQVVVSVKIMTLVIESELSQA
jgi:hypothetical protein